MTPYLPAPTDNMTVDIVFAVGKRYVLQSICSPVDPGKGSIPEMSLYTTVGSDRFIGMTRGKKILKLQNRNSGVIINEKRKD